MRASVDPTRGENCAEHDYREGERNVAGRHTQGEQTSAHHLENADDGYEQLRRRQAPMTEARHKRTGSKSFGSPEDTKKSPTRIRRAARIYGVLRVMVDPFRPSTGHIPFAYSVSKVSIGLTV